MKLFEIWDIKVKCISLTAHSTIITLSGNGAVCGCYPLGKISSKVKHFYLVHLKLNILWAIDFPYDQFNICCGWTVKNKSRMFKQE